MTHNMYWHIGKEQWFNHLTPVYDCANKRTIIQASGQSFLPRPDPTKDNEVRPSPLSGKGEPFTISSKCRTTLETAGLCNVAAYQMSHLLGAPRPLTCLGRTSFPQIPRIKSYPESVISWHLFGNLNSTGGAKGALHRAVDGELEGGKSTNHEQTGVDTGVRATEAELFADLDQTGGGALTGSTLGLVDLGQHGVGGLGDEGSSETGHQTGAQVDTSLEAVGHVLLGEGLEDGLRDLLEDDELGHGVRNPGERGFV